MNYNPPFKCLFNKSAIRYFFKKLPFILQTFSVHKFMFYSVYERVSVVALQSSTPPPPPPPMKPTLTLWGSLSNQEVSNSASSRRARRSDATTFEQNKRIFLSTFPRTGFNTEVCSTLAFHNYISTPLVPDTRNRSAYDVVRTEGDIW